MMFSLSLVKLTYGGLTIGILLLFSLSTNNPPKDYIILLSMVTKVVVMVVWMLDSKEMVETMLVSILLKPFLKLIPQ
jgi:hypothetical protein